MLRGQILHRFHVARVKRCQHTRKDVSLQHVPETCPCNFCTSVYTLRFGPSNMSLLHIPATCPFSVHLKRFCPRYMLQQHVPATCPLVWAHLKGFFGEMIRSDLIKFENWVKCADSTVPLIGRKYTRKLLHLKFNLQFIRHNSFLPLCCSIKKEGCIPETVQSFT